MLRGGGSGSGDAYLLVEEHERVDRVLVQLVVLGLDGVVLGAAAESTGFNVGHISSTARNIRVALEIANLFVELHVVRLERCNLSPLLRQLLLQLGHILYARCNRNR